MNVWVTMCVCVCVWEYACLKICIICFQLHIQNHFNAEDTIMYFDYMNYQKLLILFSTIFLDLPSKIEKHLYDVTKGN